MYFCLTLIIDFGRRRIYFIVTYFVVICKYKMSMGDLYSELCVRNRQLHRNASNI